MQSPEGEVLALLALVFSEEQEISSSSPTANARRLFQCL